MRPNLFIVMLAIAAPFLAQGQSMSKVNNLSGKPVAISKQQPLVGTWKLISYNYAGIPRKLDADKVCMKYITPTHYNWVYYNTQNQEVIGTNGGNYTLEGTRYREQVDFMKSSGSDFRNILYKNCHSTQEQAAEQEKLSKSLEVQVQGDMLVYRGTLTNGTAIEETWQRVK